MRYPFTEVGVKPTREGHEDQMASRLRIAHRFSSWWMSRSGCRGHGSNEAASFGRSRAPGMLSQRIPSHSPRRNGSGGFAKRLGSVGRSPAPAPPSRLEARRLGCILGRPSACGGARPHHTGTARLLRWCLARPSTTQGCRASTPSRPGCLDRTARRPPSPHQRPTPRFPAECGRSPAGRLVERGRCRGGESRRRTRRSLPRVGRPHARRTTEGPFRALRTCQRLVPP